MQVNRTTALLEMYEIDWERVSPAPTPTGARVMAARFEFLLIVSESFGV